MALSYTRAPAHLNQHACRVVLRYCGMRFMDWDDLRFVLAIRRAGSALQAAQALGVNQTTVTRRVGRMEAVLGVELFDRRQAGYVATPHGEKVAAAAEGIEATIARLDDELAAERRELTGTVRLTTSEIMANKLVAPCLGRFRKLHPGILIQLIVADRRLDIARGEADIALRASPQPEGGGIVFRRMPSAAWAVYCGRSYAEEHGMPADRAAITRHSIIGMEGPMANTIPYRWLAASAADADIRFYSNSLTSLVANLRAGLGIAMLPCLLGDEEEELLRCFAPPSELDADLWLILRENLRAAPHIRAFADFLANHLQSIRTTLAGVNVTGRSPG